MKAWCLALWPLIAAAQPADWVHIPAGAKVENPFEMGRTEVTVRQFETFAKATGYRTTAEVEGSARTWRAPGFRVEPRQPVVYVTVDDARAFCAWAGGRLPTNEEWEHAARAGASTRHYWGDVIDGRYLWYRPNSGGRPRAVGTRRPNAWGLRDMQGNVWEWALAGEETASRRGASWVSCEDIVGAPGRGNSPLIAIDTQYKIPVSLRHRYDDIGFRCARDAAPPR
jgi:formylglycine-generating enzyme required for sulfatase activity